MERCSLVIEMSVSRCYEGTRSRRWLPSSTSWHLKSICDVDLCLLVTWFRFSVDAFEGCSLLPGWPTMGLNRIRKKNRTPASVSSSPVSRELFDPDDHPVGICSPWRLTFEWLFHQTNSKTTRVSQLNVNSRYWLTSWHLWRNRPLIGWRFRQSHHSVNHLMFPSEFYNDEVDAIFIIAMLVCMHVQDHLNSASQLGCYSVTT